MASRWTRPQRHHEPFAGLRDRHHLSPVGRTRRSGPEFQVDVRGERMAAVVVRRPFYTKGSVKR